MTRWNRPISFLVVGIFFIGSSLAFKAEAKGPRRDPDAPTAKQAKVLGWGPVKTPNRGKYAEYLIRGIVLDSRSAKGRKGQYSVTILPIEVLNNKQRFITFDHFISGINVVAAVPKNNTKYLKKGSVVEYHQYYTEEVKQSIGKATFVNRVLNKRLVGYPVSAQAYVAKPGFYEEQVINALKGVEMYSGSVSADKDLESALKYHATRSRNSELKSLAGKQLAKLFSASPSGSCRKSVERYECR